MRFRVKNIDFIFTQSVVEKNNKKITKIFLTIFLHIKNSDENDVGVLLLYEKVFKNLWVSDSQKFFKIYFLIEG